MDTRTRLLKFLTIVSRNVKLGPDKLNIGGSLRKLFETLDLGTTANDRIASSDVDKSVRSALTRGINTLMDWNDKDLPLPEIDFLLTDLESSMRSDPDYYDTVEEALIAVWNNSITIDEQRQIIHSELQNLSQDIGGSDLSLKLYRMSNQITTQVESGIDISKTIKEFLEEIQETSKTLVGDVSSLLLSYVDFNKRETVKKLVDELYATEEGGAILRFGWQDLNIALQDGIRLGQFMMIGALQHQNKTGITLNIFRHIAIYNKPIERKPGKAPCLVRLSFEDDLTSNYRYILKDIFHDKFGESKNIDELTEDEIIDVVDKELTQHGWRIILAKGNPSEWDYLKIQAFANQLINDGLDPQLFMCDYLLKVPTIGCDRHGPTGTDYRDMVRRTRNYFNKIGCAFITPTQLSPGAKELLKSGSIRDIDFLPHIAGGGFTANSRQIDQELDISMLIHLVSHGDDVYQHIVIDKHRLPTYISEHSKRFLLKMSDNFMPLKSDIGKEPLGVKRLPTIATTNSEY